MRKSFKENIVVFGGTFDPIHMGHLAVVDYTLRNNIASCVMLVPSGVPPFKANRVSLSKEERLYLCRLALIDYKNIYGSEYSDRVFINDYELNSPAYSYTSETIKHIKNTYMIEDKVNFIIGDDIVDELPKSIVPFWEFIDNIITYYKIHLIFYHIGVFYVFNCF